MCLISRIGVGMRDERLMCFCAQKPSACDPWSGDLLRQILRVERRRGDPCRRCPRVGRASSRAGMQTRHHVGSPRRPRVPKALLLPLVLIGSFLLSPRFSLALKKTARSGRVNSIQRHIPESKPQWGYSDI